MQIALAVLLGIALGVIAGLMEAGLWIDPRRTGPVEPSDHLLPLGILVGGELANGLLYNFVTRSEEVTTVFGIAVLATFIVAIIVVAAIKWRSGR
jgi:hypothetical protein